MTKNSMKAIEEVERVFEQLNALLDAQCRGLRDRLPDLNVASSIELKKLEMYGDFNIPTPDDAELARKEPKWFDGYRYGLLRGYFRTLLWLLADHDYDLLDEID